MALYSLHCADVPLRNCSLTHSLIVYVQFILVRLAKLRLPSTTLVVSPHQPIQVGSPVDQCFELIFLVAD